MKYPYSIDKIMIEKKNTSETPETSEAQILKELRFGFIGPSPVAGMGEPWVMKLEKTFELLKSLNIEAILTLTEEDLYGPAYMQAGFIHHHEPIEDCEPPTVEGMDRALNFINACLEKNLGVAVHCFEGRGRTGTVLCAWMGRQEALNARQALDKLYRLRPDSAVTPSQRTFLAHYLEK